MTVAQKLKELYSSSIKINISGKSRAGDIRHNYADLSKITNMLGFQPRYSFDSGIHKFKNWVEKQEIYKDNYQETLRLLSKKGFIK